MATAGATSATLVVHDTIAPRPSSTMDSAVTRRKYSNPPSPTSTEPSESTGLPPPSAAVSAPSANSTHSTRGIVGSTPRGIRASIAATAISSATAPIGTQPG